MFADRYPLLFYLMVIVSVILALLISIFPLPEGYAILRPELICLIVVYWVTNAPQHLGVTFAFFTGLSYDLIQHTVWGAHGLGLVIVAYICINAYQRFTRYSVWHQALWVCVLVGVHQIVVNWIQSLSGYHAPLGVLLGATVMTSLLWPPFLFGLRRLRQNLRLV